MAKLKSSAKTKGAKASTKSNAESLQAKAEGVSRSIVDSAQQIWLAGMGAFGRAQEEGTKLFEALVNEGIGLEKKTRKLATGKVDAVRDAVEHKVGAVKERAADTWDRLEKVFEERVQRALNRLGVPSSEDLQGLSQRVDQLNAELRRLSVKQNAAASKPVSKPAAKKAAKSAAPKAARKAAPAADAAPIQDATD